MGVVDQRGFQSSCVRGVRFVWRARPLKHVSSSICSLESAQLSSCSKTVLRRGIKRLPAAASKLKEKGKEV